MVQEAMSYIPVVPEGEVRVGLINMLQGLAAGKIYLELERAQVCVWASRGGPTQCPLLSACADHISRATLNPKPPISGLLFEWGS